jgi:BirA family biotin operon repressor/biotin-[acetyl-CoA-carboxylase] ligase
MPAPAGQYDAQSSEELARRLGLPRVVVYDEIASTLDAAHALAADGAPEGTLVLADMQTAGRGRLGRTWTSMPGAGIWLTLIARPRDVDALDVLSLRVGLALAPALEPFLDDDVRLKWPNDIYVSSLKLAGILVEARWREVVPEWVAIGVGINLLPPPNETRAAGLRPGTSRLSVLDAVIPAVCSAAAASGLLNEVELRAFADRDLARDRLCLEPVSGVVHGIDERGSLLVDVGSHTVAVRTGSLVLKEAQ